MLLQYQIYSCVSCLFGLELAVVALHSLEAGKTADRFSGYITGGSELLNTVQQVSYYTGYSQ